MINFELHLYVGVSNIQEALEWYEHFRIILFEIY